RPPYWPGGCGAWCSWDGRRGRQGTQVAEPDQTNLSCLDLPAYPLVAQGPKLDLALHGIARGKPRLHVPGVTGELGYALAHLSVHEAKQPFEGDLLEMPVATPLAVELPDVAGLGMPPHWY